MSDRLAILIGNGRFENERSLPALEGVGPDVASLGKLLSDPEAGNFVVFESLDRDSRQLQPELDRAFALGHAGAAVLVYYGGYVLADPGRGLFLATADTELRGQKIKEGDELVMFYASANRDEDVFDDPFSFRVDRDPNPHLGFGIGEHFCLGSHLARLEMEVAYKYLLPRIDEIELDGKVERLHSSLVGGVKKLPIRYTLKPE